MEEEPAEEPQEEAPAAEDDELDSLAAHLGLDSTQTFSL